MRHISSMIDHVRATESSRGTEAELWNRTGLEDQKEPAQPVTSAEASERDELRAILPMAASPED